MQSDILDQLDQLDQFTDPKVEWIESFLNNGMPVFPLRGKVPTIKEWQNITVEQSRNGMYQSCLDGNYGVVLNRETMVLDIDNVASYKKLCDTLGSKPHEVCNFIVKTGSDKLHLYFKLPLSTNVVYKLKDYPGLEFRSIGHQMVGPGSIHPKTGKAYSVHRGSPSTMSFAPADLLDLIKPSAAVVPTEVKGTDQYFDDEQTVSRYRDYLSNADPAIEGEGGDAHTLSIAMKGKDLGLSPEKVMECMLYWNDTCEPPWDYDELQTKVQNAYAYGKNAVGSANPVNDFQVEGLDIDTLKPKKDKNGKIITSLTNIVALIHQDPNLKAFIRLNRFTDDIEFVRPAPWHTDYEVLKWTDKETVQLKMYLNMRYRVEISQEKLIEAIVVISDRYAYHPVKTYLESLEWDGVPRLDNWLTTYCCVAPIEGSTYVSDVGRLILLAAVRRIYEPGAKFDYMLVLEGKQKIRKSTACEILGKDWYGDPTMDVSNKDSVGQIRSKWIIEMAEMETTTKAETNQLKAFLSRRTDRIRMPFERFTQDFPRQCVFIGTINPDNSGYLKDKTGNRRFWPVYCNGLIDADGLRRDVDQIWAEAYARHKQAPNERLDLSPEAEATANGVVMDRTPADEWSAVFQDYLDSRGLDRIRGVQVWEQILNGSVRDFTFRESQRVASALYAIGWYRGTYRDNNGRYVKGFIRPIQEEEGGVIEQQTDEELL